MHTKFVFTRTYAEFNELLVSILGSKFWDGLDSKEGDTGIIKELRKAFSDKKIMSEQARFECIKKICVEHQADIKSKMTFWVGKDHPMVEVLMELITEQDWLLLRLMVEQVHYSQPSTAGAVVTDISFGTSSSKD